MFCVLQILRIVALVLAWLVTVLLQLLQICRARCAGLLSLFFADLLWRRGGGGRTLRRGDRRSNKSGRDDDHKGEQRRAVVKHEHVSKGSYETLFAALTCGPDLRTYFATIP